MLDCWTGIEFLKVLQELRFSWPQIITDFLQGISSILFYMALPILIFFIMFWFVNKRDGEFCMMNTICAYMIANFFKLIIKEPRPYEIDKSIIPTYEETSYSTPSAHTAIATAGYGSLILVIKNNIWRIVFFVLLALIIFSRLWMGLHTPLDVILGIIVAVAVMVANWYLLKISYESERNYYIVGFAYIIIFALVLASIAINIDNDYKNLSLGSGFLMGLLVSRLLEHRYVSHEVQDYSLKNKVILGFIGILVTGIIIGITYITGNLALMFTGGFLALLWGYVVFPYLMKNKISFFAKFCE